MTGDQRDSKVINPYLRVGRISLCDTTFIILKTTTYLEDRDPSWPYLIQNYPYRILEEYAESILAVEGIWSRMMTTKAPNHYPDPFAKTLCLKLSVAIAS